MPTTTTTANPLAASTRRWVHGNRTYTADRADQCRYCGRYVTGDCAPVACLLCGSVQCHGNGGSDGTCSVCCYGWLPGWSRSDRGCGYKRCIEEAISNAPRVRRACRTHADRARVRLIGGGSKTLIEVARDAVAHRDSGQGWEHWRLINLPPRPATT